MPPFLKLVPLPRLADLPKPVVLGIGLAAGLPAAVLHVGQNIAAHAVQEVVTTGLGLVGKASELLPTGRRPLPEDDDEPYATYDLDTSAWGAADTDADIVALFDEAEDDEVPLERQADAELAAVSDAPPVPDAPAEEVVQSAPEPELAMHVEPGLAAAVHDREEPAPASPSREDLPVEGYDGLSGSAIKAHLKGMPAADLRALRDYEAAHARRVTVLAMLEREIAKAFR